MIISRIVLRIFPIMMFAYLFIFLFSFTAIPTAQASAGWYPTFSGDVIKTRFCLPFSTKFTAYLQVTDQPGGFKKTVAKIESRTLKKSPSCSRFMKDSLIPGSGPFELEYEWRVNVSGSFALQLYVPTKKRTFFGWPDGIEVAKPKS